MGRIQLDQQNMEAENLEDHLESTKPLCATVGCHLQYIHFLFSLLVVFLSDSKTKPLNTSQRWKNTGENLKLLSSKPDVF